MNRGKGEDTKRRGEETREIKISKCKKAKRGEETRRGKEKKGGRGGRTFILTSQLL